MPSFAEWLKGSGRDFLRRWKVLLAVTGASGAATLAGGFLPLIPALLLTLFGVGPAWAVWGIASMASVTALLWLSAWAQAAVLRAAATEETAGECLTRSWGQTGPFAWVLSLVLLAVVGGFFLFVVPGLLLSVLLFAAPFSSILGEAQGARALALSWARVKPRFGAVALRLSAATVVCAAPGLIPWIGPLVMIVWAPFGIVAMARLDRDLLAADPAPAPPRWMGGAVAGLSAAAVLGFALAGFLAARAAVDAVVNFDKPGGLASRVRPETAQAVLTAFSGQGTDDDKRKAATELLAELRRPAP